MITFKNKILAQILMCKGCCCGNTEKGKPGVPEAWLKEQWKVNSLKHTVTLAFSGCLGPCSLTNVIHISFKDSSIWLGNIDQTSHYEDLVNWAVECQNSKSVVPLPPGLDKHRFDRFEESPQKLEAS